MVAMPCDSFISWNKSNENPKDKQEQIETDECKENQHERT